MKKILFLVLLSVTLASAQTQVFNIPVKLKSVSTLSPVGPTTQVLVLGADGLIQKVNASDIGGGGGSGDLQSTCDNGRSWISTTDPSYVKYLSFGDFENFASDGFLWQGKENSFAVDPLGFTLFSGKQTDSGSEPTVPRIKLRGSVPLENGVLVFNLPNNKPFNNSGGLGEYTGEYTLATTTDIAITASAFGLDYQGDLDTQFTIDSPASGESGFMQFRSGIDQVFSLSTGGLQIQAKDIETSTGIRLIGLNVTGKQFEFNLPTYLDEGTYDIAVKNTVYDIANLPATPSLGDTAIVNDALAPTYLGTLTAGGSVVTPVFFNGTDWVAH